MNMQTIKSRGMVLGIAAVFLFLGILFTCQDVHAAILTAEDTAAPTEPVSPPEQKNGWQENGTYYKDGVMLTGFQTIDGVLYSLDAATGVKQTNVYAKYQDKLYYFGQDGAGAAPYPPVPVQSGHKAHTSTAPAKYLLQRHSLLFDRAYLSSANQKNCPNISGSAFSRLLLALPHKASADNPPGQNTPSPPCTKCPLTPTFDDKLSKTSTDRFRLPFL